MGKLREDRHDRHVGSLPANLAAGRHGEPGKLGRRDFTILFAEIWAAVLLGPAPAPRPPGSPFDFSPSPHTNLWPHQTVSTLSP